MPVQYRLTHAVTKVTPDWDGAEELLTLTGMAGERVSFQVAWRADTGVGSQPVQPVQLKVTGAPVTIHRVELVPVQVPCWDSSGEGYLATSPAMLPDLLRPLASGPHGWVDLEPTHTGWHSAWVDVELPASGITVELEHAGGSLGVEEVAVRSIPLRRVAPAATITQWFHADTLATHYGVEAWSQQHWAAVASQVRSAAAMGVTMLLTPLWTPPLDTAVGTYRLTTQLLDISLVDGVYQFGTSRLERWLGILEQEGIHQVEVPHLFTQWGARHAPSFMIEVEGNTERLFGWDTDATDPAYVAFLEQLVPFVRDFLHARLGRDNVAFHVSDEPSEGHLESYRMAREAVAPLLEGCLVIDALSDPAYVSLVPTPVVATTAVEAFRERGMEPQWVYYCVGQHRDVSNRFIAQEAIRTRALGWQMYVNGATGFLQWAFNFYNSQLSRFPVNPFLDTSAGGRFPSGDSFIVYPGPGGTTLESVRHRLFRGAIDDLALAQQAEAILGRERVMTIIDPDGNLDYASGWVDGSEWLRRRSELLDACAEG